MTLQKDPEGMEVRYLQESVDFAEKSVLEIGSGDGRLTWRYARSAGRVIGIDPDLVSLTAACAGRPAELRETVSLVGASSLDLPFPRASFDLAVLAWSF